MAKGGKKSNNKDGARAIATNRRAYHDFFVLKEYEAGVQLVGTEVKSLRDGHCQMQGCYARVDEDQPAVWMHSVSIPEYKNAGPAFQHEPQRKRKLLLHKREIEAIRRALNEEGTTLIPLKLYFKNNRVKVSFGVCRGKRKVDKRDTMKKRDINRDIDRYMKR